jgi:hypothetical protein
MSNSPTRLTTLTVVKPEEPPASGSSVSIHNSPRLDGATTKEVLCM